MKRSAALLASSVLALAFGAHAQPAAPPTSDFITAAAQTDKFERDEGRLAETQGASAGVKGFGRQMVAAHTKTTAALKAAIAKAGLPPPAPPMLTPEQQANVDSLKGLHGAAFDKAYIAQQIQAHQTALGVMQAYAASGDNPMIRKAAADTVPVVKMHLSMAQQLQ